jgi:hypothetical protein
MDLHRIAARVAELQVIPTKSGGIPSITEKLWEGLNTLQGPFEEQNLRALKDGGQVSYPLIEASDLTTDLTLEDGHVVRMEVVRTGKDEDGDFIKVYIQIPETGAFEEIWEGPPFTLGLSEEDVEEAAEAVYHNI